MWDVVIVGAGSAGLSAALALGRARRRTLVLGHGAPRNAPAAHAHNLFTRDGTPPPELLRIAREQLAPYGSVELRDVAAVEARRAEAGFVVRDGAGDEHRTRRILLACGVEDLLPPIEGIRRFWGDSVIHCPYCHGWEAKDGRIAVLAGPETAMELVRLIRGWTSGIVLCTNGEGRLPDDDRARLERLGIPLHQERVVAVEGAGRVERVCFADGSSLECDTLFLRPRQRARGELHDQLGCERTETGLVRAGADWQTTVAGVYAAGDMASPMQQVILAAASGTAAAIIMNRALLEEDFDRAVAAS